MKLSDYIIAIDGPAASGKTTAASMLASRVGYLYINTGAMYRALALKALHAGIPPDDSARIERLLEGTNISLERKPGGSTSVTLDGEDVSEEIKSDRVADAASAISKLPAVRKYMVSQQRKIASRGGTVAEGRDTTTVVFPDAPYKFFIDASLEVRAERRQKELLAQGISIPLNQVKEDLRRRNHADRTRELSPLKKHRDAILIDSTNLTAKQVVDQILSYLGRSIGHKEKTASATTDPHQGADDHQGRARRRN